MKVTLRSDDHPDVVIEANETIKLTRLDQHIRTLQTARRWLVRESRIKRDRDARIAAEQKKQQKVAAT